MKGVFFTFVTVIILAFPFFTAAQIVDTDIGKGIVVPYGTMNHLNSFALKNGELFPHDKNTPQSSPFISPANKYQSPSFDGYRHIQININANKWFYAKEEWFLGKRTTVYRSRPLGQIIKINKLNLCGCK